jgi:hypothetical protein
VLCPEEIVTEVTVVPPELDAKTPPVEFDDRLITVFALAPTTFP